MAYFIDLFSPETYNAFSASDQTISGFRQTQEVYAKKIKPGDKLICYLTKMSRWIGILEVTSSHFIDNTPIFYTKDDPFIVRFKVKPIVWLEKEYTIPIKEEVVWNNLSFTQRQPLISHKWTNKVRGSLRDIPSKDGKFLEEFLIRQADEKKKYEIDEEVFNKLSVHKVHRVDRTVDVSIPDDSDRTEIIDEQDTAPARKSIFIQSLIARIGEQMGLKIWIPRADRKAVLSEWSPSGNILLEELPLNYDLATLKTIEQIDVIWLKGRAIVRAFEVEHTTSIYSGILRMADLLALQPNMNIKLHIVAPYERREKVFQEIKRPVFSLLDEAPLSERCTFISYDSIEELSQQKHLSHLSDTVVDEYTEEAE